MENTKKRTAEQLQYILGGTVAVICVIWAAITILALPIAAIKYILQ